jgi:hypothetical protein
MDTFCGNMSNIIPRSWRKRRVGRRGSTQQVFLSVKMHTSTDIRRVEKNGTEVPQTSSHTFYGWEQTQTATVRTALARFVHQKGTTRTSQSRRKHKHQCQ